jgi:hypothetical protein
VIKKVDNHNIISTYKLNYNDVRTSNKICDLVIITKKQLKKDFNLLTEKHAENGINCFIKSVDDIYSEFTDIDKKEKIRIFIRYAYEIWQTEFILLAGDVGIIPVRILYVKNYIFKL